jgi:hypothetical protein
MFISFFMQWLRKPIWGYPLMYLCAEMVISTFLVLSYGGTRLPDTGKSVVPWVILDWWTPHDCGANPRRSCDSSQQADWVGSDLHAWVDVWTNEPVPFALIGGQMDALLSGSSFARQESWCISAQGWEKYHSYVRSQMKKWTFNNTWKIHYFTTVD